MKSKAQNEEQIIESKLIYEDVVSRIAIAMIELADVKEHDPRLGKGQNLQSFIDPELRTRHYFGRKLIIQVLDAHGQVISNIKQADYSNSLNPNFNSNNEIFKNDAAAGFRIAKPNGTVLHNFDIAAHSILFFGQFLIFIEKDSIKSNNTLSLYFIDLRYAKVNLGNAPLPIFTLPINAQSNPSHVAVESGRLKIDDLTITHEPR